ncbi:hypothetical protein J6590_105911 [Homalodisca vitripennis]|nr:hypothetical protein J6590_105911 [Homalodisca vitripennis]
MDKFHTSSIQQKSMECKGSYIDFSPPMQEIQNVSIDEDLKMDWKRIDEIHDDSSPLVQEIQNVSIDEDLKMDWKRIDEIHDDSSPLVQEIQNVSIAEDLKMDWKRIDEIHNGSSPLVQEIQDLCIADDLKKDSTENNKNSTSFHCHRSRAIRAGLGCVLCVGGLAAIPCVSSESDSGQVTLTQPTWCNVRRVGRRLLGYAAGAILGRRRRSYVGSRMRIKHLGQLNLKLRQTVPCLG